LSGRDQLIDKQEFFDGLEISNKVLSDRLFDIFDKDKNGRIDHDEFLTTIESIILGSQKDKIKFAFNLHDLDNSGFIDRKELKILIIQSFTQNNLDFDDFQLAILVDEIFLKADKDKNDRIDFNEFLTIANDFPDFIDGFAVNPVKWLTSNNGLLSSNKPDKKEISKEIQVQEIGFFQSFLIPKMISYYNILLNRKKNHTRTQIISAFLLPSKTLEIILKPSKKFECKPGDYVYVNCRNISPIEWHPFNIIRMTQNNELVFHVKSVDSCTKNLFRSVLEIYKKNKIFSLNIKIDGPYGSSSKNILNAEHAILIGVGHGISKIAPVLQDIAMRLNKKPNNVSLKKISLYWLIENETYFEWFTKFLDEIEGEEKINILSYNIFFIDKSAHEVSENLMYMSTDLTETKTDVTLINNIWGKSKFGFPDWKNEFNTIATLNVETQNHIFYSGPKKYKSTIKKESKNFKIIFDKKTF
jgi:Ca2+-binding EF-hand superfamily protein